MKISKLFHWLYAFLMFLPIVLFIPDALYYGFNEHATNSETTTITYKYQSNEVNTLDDLVADNIYHLSRWDIADYSFTNVLNNNGYIYFQILSYDVFNFPYDLVEDLYIDEIITDTYTNDTENYVGFNLYPNSVGLLFSNGNAYNSSYVDVDISTYGGSIQLIDAVVQIGADFVDYVNQYEPNLLNVNNFKLEYTDYNVIESVEINTDDTISNKMYQAWQSTWNLPLLQWTHTSFVAQPFSYITGLFGVPSDSTLNYIFAYFVSISICWLVFDLIMYVPNLAHRWLDKGAIE